MINLPDQWHRSFPVLTAILLILHLLGGVSFANAEGGKLVITGSSTMAPLILEIGKRFEKFHSTARVDVQTGGPSRGIADAMKGIADIGMVSRALGPTETHLHGAIVAHDGITIILNSSNPVEKLAHDEIRNIYTGRITNWAEVGGTESPITVVNKAQGRSTRELFLQFFQLSNRSIRAHVVIGDNEQGIKTVAGNPNAIGYVSVGTAQYDSSQGVPIRLLPLNSVPASVQTIRAGRFPLARPLTLVTKSAPRGLTKTFIAFAQSSDVYDLITNQYFIPHQE